VFPPRPFWFVAPELLIQIRRDEFDAVAQLLAKYPNLRNMFDSADATLSQRTAGYEVLAHFEVVQAIDETFIASYDPPPPLSDVEADTLRRTHNLVAADAPAWVLEMQQVVEQLPSHLNAALPEPLRGGGYRHDNPEQNRLIESAVGTFSSFEQIRALIERVRDQQLRRLQQRWSPTQGEPKKPKHWLKGTQGLTRKADLSQYKQGLTERQELAFSLKWEYGLKLAEIASRMGIDRKTAYEHIEAAKKKMEETISNEKGAVNRAKHDLDF